MNSPLGPIYTKGTSYRARAEARQREYRASVLDVAHGAYGHFLAPEAANEGKNFLLEEAFEAARNRQIAGKGVAQRTFENMLSSQAMCFNVFAPLGNRLDLATEVLEPFIPGLTQVTAIHIEHTPAKDIFNDQTGQGGVDCDLLIEGKTTAGKLLQVVETKFVETEFSVCGFRKPGRAGKGLDVCPDVVGVRENRDACLYMQKKKYGYWLRSDEFSVLSGAAMPRQGCPFSGDLWQPWVNLVLAHAEAERRGATQIRFGVCTSSRNTALLRDGEALASFRALLRDRKAVSLIDLEILLERVEAVAPSDLRGWTEQLCARYRGI